MISINHLPREAAFKFNIKKVVIKIRNKASWNFAVGPLKGRGTGGPSTDCLHSDYILYMLRMIIIIIYNVCNIYYREHWTPWFTVIQVTALFVDTPELGTVIFETGPEPAGFRIMCRLAGSRCF